MRVHSWVAASDPPSLAFTSTRYSVSGASPLNVTTCAVPTAALKTSVHGQLVVAVYDTQPVAGSLVVKLTVTPEDVTFDVTMFVISGAVVVSIVLSLETTGPLLIRALQSQDMYLAGSFLMFLSFLTVIGVLISDIALAILDPRIRLQGTATK